MTTKEFFKHPATITIGIVITLGLLAWVGKTYWGWFGGKKGACARKTGFNLQDLEPGAITNTMGMNRREFEECMGTDKPIQNGGTGVSGGRYSNPITEKPKITTTEGTGEVGYPDGESNRATSSPIAKWVNCHNHGVVYPLPTQNNILFTTWMQNECRPVVNNFGAFIQTYPFPTQPATGFNAKQLTKIAEQIKSTFNSQHSDIKVTYQVI